MEYVSTRDKSRKVSASYAIANGIAPDGGLYCPTSFPALTAEDWHALANLDYKGRSALILGKFLTDFSGEELADYAAKAYADNKFGGADTAPVVALGGGKHMLELWHGPTCAFKDMALQMLPHLLTASLRKTGETRTACILVATSGDTGKAALDGFHDVEGTKIMVYYPVDGVSPMQKLQMVTQEGKNVEVVAIRGNFDDAQSAVKRIFTDETVREGLDKDGMMLSSANSINWGRLAPQIAYYVSAYCDMVKNGAVKMGGKINICVPTGNFGNILAAYIAKKMGLPVNKLICASNANNVLTDFLTTGVYDRNRAFYATTSPSMDILISSNLERLLYDLCGRDDATIRDWFGQLGKTGRYEVSQDVKDQIKELFWAGCCDDEGTKQTIGDTFRKDHYLCDTHTAVAVNVYRQYKEATGDETKTVIASTASPYKFASSVLGAIADNIPEDEYAQIDELNRISGLPVPKALAELKNKPVRFTGSIEKSEMEETVLKLLGIG